MYLYQGFHNVFSKETGFHRWAERSELNFFMRNKMFLYNRSDGQTQQQKSLTDLMFSSISQICTISSFDCNYLNFLHFFFII